MARKQVYSPESFYGKYEGVIRDRLGTELDELSNLLVDIGNKCLNKLLDLRDNERGLTVAELLQGDKQRRCQVLAITLYDDALWRLEAAYLMMSIGLLDIAYTNLRTSFEEVTRAFVIERLDLAAVKFLKNQSLDQKRLERYIPEDCNDPLKKAKELYRHKGVYINYDSIKLNTVFGPRRSDRIVAEVAEVKRPLILPDGFIDAASGCIKQARNIGLLFLRLIDMPVM